jgi:hypothetical protein
LLQFTELDICNENGLISSEKNDDNKNDNSSSNVDKNEEKEKNKKRLKGKAKEKEKEKEKQKQKSEYDKKYTVNIDGETNVLYVKEEYSENELNQNFKKTRKNLNINKRLECHKLQDKIFGPGFRINCYYRKNEIGEITYYRINSYLENGIIWFECGDKTCGASCKFDIEKKEFINVRDHRLEYNSHKYFSKNKSERVMHYTELFKSYPDMNEMIVLRVPDESASLLYGNNLNSDMNKKNEKISKSRSKSSKKKTFLRKKFKKSHDKNINSKDENKDTNDIDFDYKYYKNYTLKNNEINKDEIYLIRKDIEDNNLRLNIHFHRDNENKIYKYIPKEKDMANNHSFSCSSNLCKSLGSYCLESRKFLIISGHSIKYEKHYKKNNDKNFTFITQYFKEHPDINDIQIIEGIE